VTSARSKFYIGASFSNTSYLLIRDTPQESGTFAPIALLNAGYQLNKRTILQVGVGYGQHKLDGRANHYKSADSTIYSHNYRRTWGVAVPITIRYTPFNPDKRLLLYGTASLIPAFGSVESFRTEEKDGVKNTIYSSHGMAFNVMATAGLMLNYRISKRLDGYIEANIFNRSLNQLSNYPNPRPKSVGLGLNFKL